MPKKKNITTPEEEKARFIAAAAELGCEDSPEAFTATLKVLAQAEPITNACIAMQKKRKNENE